MKKLMTTLLFVLLYGTGLCFAEGGVTVSGTVTFENPYSPGQIAEGSASGTVKLLQNGSEIYTGNVTSEYNNSLGKSISSYTIENVETGTYTLQFLGDGYGKVLVYETASLEVSTEDVTHDFRATVDDTRGIMQISVQTGEWNGDYYANSRYLTGATVSCLPSGEGQQVLTATAEGNYATVKFFVPSAEGTKYTITAQHESCYDTTFETAFSANIYLY
ncbi:MAG: hypothetical protein K2H70_02710, partial [Bacteroidales bacterium]|nr:hypothetical protein [Bacteroidales bacterium]